MLREQGTRGRHERSEQVRCGPAQLRAARSDAGAAAVQRPGDPRQPGTHPEADSRALGEVVTALGAPTVLS